jgi:hypothetical protein
MKSRNLLIAAVVLAALTGALYWSNKHKPEEKPATDAANESTKMYSLKDGDVSKIAIKKRGSEELDLAKNDAGKWEITAPKKYSADQESISSILSNLSAPSAERVVDDKASDLGQYGLSSPAIEIDLTQKDNKSTKLLIGDDTPAGNGAFAMVQGDARVFTLASYLKSSADKSVTDLRDKRLITADFDNVSKIELTAKKQDIEFGRNKQDWQIIKPKPVRADNSKVEDLTRALRDAKVDAASLSEDPKKAAASFGGGTPVATVKITGSSGTQELQVRKNKDDYYAKSTVLEGAYKVSSDLGKGVDKDLEDFRNKKLFDFGFDDPSKVEIHDGAKAQVLTKNGQDWMLDGKKMDSSTVQSVIDKARDLSATKFPDSGFTTASFDISVTSNDGKRVEKVLIAKAGDKYFAKREGEPALYELSSTAVTDLQKAANDMKPAPPPAPEKKK